ncbi:hypothetical protein ACLOJK_012495 [Asimina triloba]
MVKQGISPAMKKVEHYSVQKVTGDGRCLFRALANPIMYPEHTIRGTFGIAFAQLLRLSPSCCEKFKSLHVKGMAINKGIALSPRQERDDADELRMAVKSVICGSEGERVKYEEALIAITVDESLKRYCQRIERPDFWGGESELLVLSKLLSQPIVVYIPEHEISLANSERLSQHSRGSWGSGFIPIAEYGAEFGKVWKKGKKPRQEFRIPEPTYSFHFLHVVYLWEIFILHGADIIENFSVIILFGAYDG